MWSISPSTNPAQGNCVALSVSQGKGDGRIRGIKWFHKSDKTQSTDHSRKVGVRIRIRIHRIRARKDSNPSNPKLSNLAHP